MKRLTPVVFSLILVLLLAACGHTHTWQEATCTLPETCSGCGETRGEALGHTWIEATCETPKTCEVCGATEGEPNGHIWEAATCQHPEQCSVCGSTKNSTLGDHVCNTWAEIVDPTCNEEGYKKGTCIHCGQEFTIILEKKSHAFGEWEEVKKASCVKPGEQKRICAECGYEETEEIAMLEHDLGEWEVSIKASYRTNGVKVQRCHLCGSIINTEEYSFADTIKDKVEIKGDAEGLTATDAHIIYACTRHFIIGQIIVEVTNESDRSFKIDAAGIDLVDKDAALLGTVNPYAIDIAPKIIEPGEKGYLLCEILESGNDLEESNGLDILAHITANATSETRDQWEVVDYRRKGINPQIVGHIRNANPETRSGFTVYCLYKDERGRLIGYTTAYYGNSIAPDETVSFSSDKVPSDLIKLETFTSVDFIVNEHAY